MVRRALSRLFGRKPVGPADDSARDPRFRSAEREFIRRNPVCAGCGGSATTAHHVIPFHVRPDLEMDESNWAPVCPDCHFVDGHARNWRKWVDNFWQVVKLKAAGLKGPVGADGSRT
jgi:5-methylcytosine-specific restriction endonuclease McrA